jgi:hypothetical protein
MLQLDLSVKLLATSVFRISLDQSKRNVEQDLIAIPQS